MNAALLGASAAAVGVPLFFAIAQRIFPASPTREELAKLDLAELARKYRKWDLAAVPMMLGSAAVLGVAWYFAIRLVVALARSGIEEGSVHSIVAEDVTWAIPALFLGLVSSAIPLHLAFKRLLGERYGEYCLYWVLKSRFDYWRVERLLSVTVAVAAVLFTAALATVSVRFTEEGIAFRGVASLSERRYSYVQVRAVKSVARFAAPLGNVIARPHFAIELDDGTVWTTRENLRTPRPEADAEIMAFVASKSGTHIEQVDFLGPR